MRIRAASRIQVKCEHCGNTYVDLPTRTAALIMRMRGSLWRVPPPTVCGGCRMAPLFSSFQGARLNT